MVAIRTALTIHVLSDWPRPAASSSALTLSDSGMRRVMRAVSPSSIERQGRGVLGADGGRVVRDGRRAGSDDDEDRLTTLEPDLDGDPVELVGDLGRRVRQRIHQGEAHAGVEGDAEPLGGLLGLLAHRPGRPGKVLTQCVHVLCDVHVHHADTIDDVMSTP